VKPNIVATRDRAISGVRCGQFGLSVLNFFVNFFGRTVGYRDS